MEIFDEGELATEEDIRGFYRFVLRREPETELALHHAAGQGFLKLLRLYLQSEEFLQGVRKPIEEGRFSQVSVIAPTTQVLAFVAERMPISATARERLSSVRTWLELYCLVLTDSECARHHGLSMDWLEATNQGRLAVRGMVWGTDGHVVIGWLKAPSDQVGPAGVELWSEWGLVSQGCASFYDGRLEGLFPDNPNCAFRLILPPADRDRILKLEVREAGSGLVIGAFEQHQVAIDRGSLGQVEQRLGQLEEGLSALRAQLPQLNYQANSRIENYSWHYKTWLAEPFSEPPFIEADLSVVIDAVGVNAVDVEACLRSVLKQSHHRLRSCVVTDKDELPLIQDAGRRLSREYGAEITAHTAQTVPVRFDADYVLLLTARALLHRDALGAMARHLESEPKAVAVYADEDCLTAPYGIDVGSNHILPRFKPDMDADLLWQDPYVGTCVALRSEAWSEVAAEVVYGGAVASQATLALSLKGLGEVEHLPFVLSSWQMSDYCQEDARVWQLRLQAIRARYGVNVDLQTYRDELGVPSRAGVGRLVWPVEPDTVTSVIIPTCNRLELLQPCVESLLDRIEDNQTQLELIIVDHASDDPDTISYLERLRDHPKIKVLPYQGAFNWALMNNLAAEQASGEVLVFLNNDTLAISRAWLDELTGQALRPGVGAVGCRLLYPDGSLQHGGFVASARPDIFLRHEGLGVLGSDGGYLGRHAIVRQTTAVTGACMAISKQVFEALGGFEAAAFPVDGNDVDFCLRARRQGMRILYTPYASFYHLESKSRGFGEQQRVAFEGASARLWDRWGKLFGCDPYYNVNFDRSAGSFDRLMRV